MVEDEQPVAAALLRIIRHRLALFFGSFDGWFFHFIHTAVEFGFEFVLCFPKLTHAAAKAAGKGGKLFGTEQDENQHGNDHHLGGAERSEGKNGGVHNEYGYVGVGRFAMRTFSFLAGLGRVWGLVLTAHSQVWRQSVNAPTARFLGMNHSDVRGENVSQDFPSIHNFLSKLFLASINSLHMRLSSRLKVGSFNVQKRVRVTNAISTNKEVSESKSTKVERFILHGFVLSWSDFFLRWTYGRLTHRLRGFLA